MTWLKSMLLMRFNDPSPNRVVFVPGCRCQQRTHKRLATMMLKGTALTFERQGSRSRFLFALRLSLSLSLSYLQRGAYFLFLWLPPRAGMRRLCRRNTSLHSSQPCNIYLCINKVFFSFLISLLVLVLLTLAHAHPPLWNRTPADDTQITLIFSPSLCIYNITYASIIYTKRKMPYGVAREKVLLLFVSHSNIRQRFSEKRRRNKIALWRLCCWRVGTTFNRPDDNTELSISPGREKSSRRGKMIGKSRLWHSPTFKANRVSKAHCICRETGGKKPRQIYYDYYR